MPTIKPRYPVTDTDEVALALDEAAARWPGVPRSRLIQRIVADWHRGGVSPPARRESRRRLVGSLPTSAALYNREDDWPA